MKASVEKHKKKDMFLRGIIAGIGWAIGVTIGFALVSTILVLFFKSLGGLPLIGDFFTSVVESTQQSLPKRTPILPR